MKTMCYIKIGELKLSFMSSPHSYNKNTSLMANRMYITAQRNQPEELEFLPNVAQKGLPQVIYMHYTSLSNKHQGVLCPDI
jgi:hypothetical protein